MYPNFFLFPLSTEKIKSVPTPPPGEERGFPTAAERVRTGLQAERPGHRKTEETWMRAVRIPGLQCHLHILPRELPLLGPAERSRAETQDLEGRHGAGAED